MIVVEENGIAPEYRYLNFIVFFYSSIRYTRDINKISWYLQNIAQETLCN